MPAPDPVHVTIHPEPTAAELAAILGAYRELWPVPVAPATEPSASSQRWRFSGRWWAEDQGQRVPRRSGSGR